VTKVKKAMTVKKQLCSILLIALLASLVPLGQPTEVYAATLTLRPNAGGDETNLTIGGTSPAATNWESVDDDPNPDEGATYVEDGGSGYTFDLYNLQDTALSGTINSVTVYVRVRGAEKTGTGATTRIKTNNVAYVGTDITVTTSYANYSTTYNTNPQTTVAWTWTEVNALQAGVGLQKPSGGAVTRCTQVWVVVDYTPPVPDITNTPSNWDFDVVEPGSEYTTGITYSPGSSGFQITNNSTFDVNITISATDMGSGWLLAGSGNPPDATHYALYAGTELTGGLYNIQVTSGGVLLVTVLASSTRDWGLKLMTPTNFTDGASKSGTVTLTATQA